MLYSCLDGQIRVYTVVHEGFALFYYLYLVHAHSMDTREASFKPADEFKFMCLISGTRKGLSKGPQGPMQCENATPLQHCRNTSSLFRYTYHVNPKNLDIIDGNFTAADEFELMRLLGGPPS